jgi:hypothetical protein
MKSIPLIIAFYDIDKSIHQSIDSSPIIFFAVECCMVPREIGVQELSDVLNNQLASASYTHHQKSIIVDSQPGQYSHGPKRG